MPIKVTGKVVDDYGQDVLNPVIIKEIPPEGQTGIADVVADASGEFTILAINPNSLIEVSAFGYAPQVYPVNDVPALIQLETAPDLVLNGNVSKKTNYLAIAAGSLVLAGIIYAAVKKKPEARPQAITKTKKLPQIKKVSV